ncbi:MAG TPA: GntR family transcriptional regulator [Terriglobales bacterium]|nr:GntR family transcriptional regulator [Terriglobales bacterium]
MKIHIDKESDVPLPDQISQQIIFLIGTGGLAIGDVLPSVRALARQLKVHFNTVSHAYTDLEQEGWLAYRRGGRLLVQPVRVTRNRPKELEDLDDLIDRTIRIARERGHSLQQLRERVRDRLLLEPADHLLIVAPERELGEVMVEEIRQAVGPTLAKCQITELRWNLGTAIGAMLLAPAYLINDLERILPKPRPLVPITYSAVDDHLAAVHNLRNPSTVGVISVSAVFLKTARGLLAPAVGGRHSFHEFLLQPPGSDHIFPLPWILGHGAEAQPPSLAVIRWEMPDRRSRRISKGVPRGRSEISGNRDFSLNSAADLLAIDLLFCDSIAYQKIKHPNRVLYRLISQQSLEQIASQSKALSGGVAPRSDH